ncbi:MAG: EVE domain-containing protein [Bdellovibrionaceae bacterium]|nr:EVE domain-containing protein [Pseudobdellovibrionaceae bacterium]MBX3035161.1 EVE domain-containing protein [Pseudobdellovibrionaceae bacterium]
MAKKHWLMKSEPDVYSLDHLLKDKTTWWEGVRNYQARNFMMKEMSVGDEVLFYHSNAEPPGVAGLAQITRAAEPDALQFQKSSEYFDPKAKKDQPVWYCVQVGGAKKFKNFISLEDLRRHKDLQDMLVLKRGQRLSIQPVTKKDFDLIKKLGGL